MAYFDMDKNSLPEQVQENKEKIKDLETNSATITYVDDKDADTLQAAKDYADGKDTTTLQAAKDYADQQKIPKSALHAKGSMIYGSDVYTPANLNIGNAGDVLKVSADGIPEWDAPAKIKAADINSESATSGKVLAADGNGGASWETASSGGMSFNLVWSGSLALSGSNTNTPVDIASLLAANKKFICVVVSRTSNVYTDIGIYDSNYGMLRLGCVLENNVGWPAIASINIDPTNSKVNAVYFNNFNTAAQLTSLTIKEIYEVV